MKVGPQFHPLLGVEAHGWLVQENNLRLMDYGTGQPYTLLLSATQFGDAITGPVFQPHDGQGLHSRL